MTAALPAEYEPADALRLCSTCAQFVPISQFRKRARNLPQRMRECNRCHNARETARRRTRRERANSHAMLHFLSAIKNEADTNKVVLLASAMMHKIGGLANLTSELIQYHHTARAKGGYAWHRSLMALLRLVEVACKLRPDVASLSDQQLHEQAAEMLRQRGWQVTPPPNEIG